MDILETIYSDTDYSESCNTSDDNIEYDDTEEEEFVVDFELNLIL